MSNDKQPVSEMDTETYERFWVHAKCHKDLCGDPTPVTDADIEAAVERYHVWTAETEAEAGFPKMLDLLKWIYENGGCADDHWGLLHDAGFSAFSIRFLAH